MGTTQPINSSIEHNFGSYRFCSFSERCSISCGHGASTALLQPSSLARALQHSPHRRSIAIPCSARAVGCFSFLDHHYLTGHMKNIK
jgi:hypothetical protein